MRQVKETGYGATGDPYHPYHCEYGPDTYYPGKKTDDELRGLFHKADQGFHAMHAFFAARACSGDLGAMETWDQINRVLATHGYVGFTGGRTSPWSESVFNLNRTRDAG